MTGAEFRKLTPSQLDEKLPVLQVLKVLQVLRVHKVLPEPQVLKRPVFSVGQGTSPVVLSPNCTNCGRCIDVCTEDVFQFSTRFSRARHPESQFVEETQS